MQEALKEAKKAGSIGEVPVGAVVVLQDKIIAKGANQVELLQDATAHAEILCITAASSFLKNWRLEGATIYTTLEPCLMCAGAIYAARIKRVIWGARDIRLGANGSWIDIFQKKHPMHSVEIIGEVLQEECGALLTEFFQKRRRENARAIR